MTGELGVRPAGDRAFLIDVGDNARVHDLAAAVRERFGAEVEDVVPGEETLLVSWRAHRPQGAELIAALKDLASRPDASAGQTPATVSLSVRYDGPDLEAVAGQVGLSIDELIQAHSRPEYRVAFMGFAPGFAYMTGGDARLRLPRRADPRQRVPAGSVAIATDYSAVYPTSGPGGWHLLGHTDAVLFDPDRDPPSLLAPGTHVVFEPSR